MQELVVGKSYLVRWLDSTEFHSYIFKKFERGFYIFIFKDEKIVARPTSVEVKESGE